MPTVNLLRGELPRSEKHPMSKEQIRPKARDTSKPQTVAHTKTATDLGFFADHQLRFRRRSSLSV
ncbi:MAG: hypothetical protein CM15mP120_07680 [Pseudomonadota bacterium]|nr:MAG: hypothetical protein CM15mP120_07680 [Pseudomonadota bacterium]